ncbi:MAG: hypothetical protein LBD23_20805 [Oscillospiraceae bacterium]|nr:hypothetical protein [Oscillospiraceae bacterium]
MNSTTQFITPNISHPMLWVSVRSKLNKTDKSYDFYPRGRVNYNVKRDVFEIDMDACLHTPEFINKLSHAYLLDRRKIEIIQPKQTNKNSPNYANEGHYSCHLCDPRKAKQS